MSAPAELQSALEKGIWYRMCVWPNLRLAVSSNWGGPDSSDKRDWFVGAVVELFDNADVKDTSTNQVQDLQADVEDRLLQIMQDEFDVNVEDESEIAVAADVVRCWTRVMQQNDTSIVTNFRDRWTREGGKVERVNVVETDQDVDDDDEDAQTAGMNGPGRDGDVEMGDATNPAITSRTQREEPIVDEDGFTTVVSKKKR